MRPAIGSTCCVNWAAEPPCRMKLPSCTLRTRSAAGLKVIVTETFERRDAFDTEIGTVYGPPPTRNSVPGGVSRICAVCGGGGRAIGVGCAPAGAPVCVAAAGGGVPAGAAVVPATCVLPGGITGTCAAGGTAAGGTAAGGATAPGSGCGCGATAAGGAVS